MQSPEGTEKFRRKRDSASQGYRCRRNESSSAVIGSVSLIYGETSRHAGWQSDDKF